MGTSLSGLTPATTFDGLLKTSDNEPLDGTLKTISDGSGVDSVLQLSNSALQVNGQATIVGAGNDATTTALLVQNSDGTQLLKVDDSGSATAVGFKTTALTINSNQILGSSGIKLRNILQASGGTSISTADGAPANTMLYVKGFGATSATTSLLVQNSAGNTALEVLDNRDIKFNLGAYQFLSNGLVSFLPINVNNELRVGFGTGTTAEARLHIKGSGNANTTTSLLVQNSDGADLFKVFDGGATRINTETLNSTIIGKNGTGGAFVVDAGIVNNIRADVNGVAINSTTSANTSFKVKGSGATSATTALLVQNLAGTDLLKVEDGGDINFNGNIYADADYKSIGRNSSNSLRYALGEARLSVQGTSSANKFHIYSSSTATSLFSVYTQTQQVGVGNGDTALDASAKLQVDSTTQGFLPPRMTTTERDAITTPAAGLMVYNTTTNKAQCYNGTTWNDLF